MSVVVRENDFGNGGEYYKCLSGAIPKKENIEKEANKNKLNILVASYIRRQVKKGVLQRDLAKKYNVADCTITRIVREEIYKPSWKKRINMEKAREIRRKYKTDKFTLQNLADIYQLDLGTVCKIVNNKIYKSKTKFNGEKGVIPFYFA